MWGTQRRPLWRAALAIPAKLPAEHVRVAFDRLATLLIGGAQRHIEPHLARTVEIHAVVRMRIEQVLGEHDLAHEHRVI